MSRIMGLWLLAWGGLTGLYAQSIQLPSGFQLAFDYQQGNTLRHRSTMVFALPDPARAYSLDIGRETNGSRAWHRYFGYPRVGVSAWMQDFGNREVLGRSWSIHPFLDFNLLYWESLRLRARLAYGFTWVDRIHHPDTNAINNAIGSNLNNITSLGLLGEWTLFQRLILRGGLTLTHNSNGRLRVPNLGLNTAKWRVGLGYMLRPAERLSTARTSEPELPRRVVGVFRTALAFKEDKTAFGPQYPVYIVSAGIAKWLGPKSRLVGGYEYFYDQGVEAFNRNQEIPEGLFKPNRHLIYAGHEFLIGHFGMMTQFFAYMDPPFQSRDPWGVKLGPHYYFWHPVRHPDRNLFVGAYLKAHKAIADYAELMVGFTF